MMPETEWYEDVEIPGIGLRKLSKFSHKEFTVAFANVESSWHGWTPEQRNKFAAAFAHSPIEVIDDERRRIIEFLMEQGEPAIWKKIARLVARHIEHSRAVEFLATRVREGIGPLTNYYRALAKISARECIPQLKDALQKHSEQVEQYPSLEKWENRFIYLDYLYCSATLFKLTGEPQYLSNLTGMRDNNVEVLRQMANTAIASTDISI